MKAICTMTGLVLSLTFGLAETPRKVDATNTRAGVVADILYAGTTNGQVGTVNQTDGSFSLLGSPATGQLSGIAFNSSNQLYVTENIPSGIMAIAPSGFGGRVGQLIRVDPTDGSLIQTIGPILASSMPIRLTGISFQPGTDTLFGVSSGEDLYTINTTTAVATLVGAVTGVTEGKGGLAFRSDGRLFLGSTSSDLLELNPADASIIGTPIGIGDCVDGLAFRPSDDVLFATECDGSDIFTIDITDGSVSVVGSGASTASLAFTVGSAPPPMDATAIPTLSEWALILLALALLGAGVLRLRSQLS